MNKTHQELVEMGREVLLEAPQLYIDIDVEADGKAGHGSLLSIGAIEPAGETFYVELKPDSPKYIKGQRKFCEEHNLQRERLLQEGTDPAEAMRQFGKWTVDLSQQYQKKPVFSAFNSGFDFGLIDLYFIKSGQPNPYGIASFDLKSRAQGLDGDWDWTKTSKDKLPKILLPEGDFTHNALEDAVYQQQIHFALAGLIRVQKLQEK